MPRTGSSARSRFLRPCCGTRCVLECKLGQSSLDFRMDVPTNTPSAASAAAFFLSCSRTKAMRKAVAESKRNQFVVRTKSSCRFCANSSGCPHEARRVRQCQKFHRLAGDLVMSRLFRVSFTIKRPVDALSALRSWWAATTSTAAMMRSFFPQAIVAVRCESCQRSGWLRWGIRCRQCAQWVSPDRLSYLQKSGWRFPL